MRRLQTFLVLCLFAPLLTGCWDAQELDHIFYVHTVGFDYEGGKCTMYTQVVNPTALSKESAKAGTKIGAWIGKGVGRSYEEALHNLYSTTQRRVYWGHVNALVFSENALAKKGVQEALEIITRYPEFRYSSWVFCSGDPMLKVLSVEPILETTPVYSLLSDPTNIFRQSSFIQQLRLYRLISNLQEPSRLNFIPEISVSENQWFDPKTTHPELKPTGYGLLQNGKLKGCLTREQASGLRWFMPSLPRAVVTLYRHKEPIATVTFNSSRYRVRPSVVGGHLRFQVQLKIQGVIVNIAKPFPEAQLESMLSQKIEKDIRKSYNAAVGLGVDIYSLSDPLYRWNPKTFHRFATKNGVIQLDRDSLQKIQVKVKIIHSGTRLEPVGQFT